MVISIVDEVATGTIWAESISMECSAEFSLIFRVKGEYAKILAAICKLTLVSILAVAILLKVSAGLCLVVWADSCSVTPLHRLGLCPFLMPVQGCIHGWSFKFS